MKRFHEHDEALVQKLSGKKILPSLKQLGYASKYLSGGERLTIRILCGVIIIAFCSLSINVYWSHSAINPEKGGSYTEGLVGSPRYINPLFAQGNDVDLDIASLIFSGLFKYSDQGLEKDLVESYEIDGNQTVYTFALKQNVAWHDGELFDADDVFFTFSRITNNTTKTPLYFNFQGIQIEKIDQFTVRFILKKPFAPFLESLTVGILPEHIWRNILPENMLMTEYNLKPVGCGPYKFKSLIKNKNGKIKTFNLEANDQYYSSSPFVSDLAFKFHDNFEQAVEALNNKKVDGISYLPKEIRARIINNRNLNFHLLHLPQYTAVFFNYDKNPILKNLTIRKILSHAVNKEKIVNEILNAEAQIIDSCVLPGSLGFAENIVKYPYNVQHAKNELDKAGWKLTDYEKAKPEEKAETKKATSDNTAATAAPAEAAASAAPTGTDAASEAAYPYPVRKLKDRYLEFSLTTVNQPETVEIAKELQKEWQQIGAKINLVIVDPANIQNTIKNRDYEALLYGQILGHDPDPYPFWHSSQKNYPGFNLTSFSNPDADKLLDDARKTTDDAKRADKYTAFQKMIGETVPAIFLFNPTYTYPQSKKIKGFTTAKIITPSNRFNKINGWYIKTDRAWSKKTSE